jgi:hypothetical protein
VVGVLVSGKYRIQSIQGPVDMSHALGEFFFTQPGIDQNTFSIGLDINRIAATTAGQYRKFQAGRARDQ